MAETINMPKLGFDMAEGTLVRWIKKEGEPIQKGEVLAEIETDKATVEVESTGTGVVRKYLITEGDVVPINTPIAIIGTAEEIIDEPVSSDTGQKPIQRRQAAVASNLSSGIPPAAMESIADPALGQTRASPLAKKIARERSLDLNNIHGSGPGGRIVRRDIDSALAGQEAYTRIRREFDKPSSINSPASLSDRKIPLGKLRAVVGRRMEEAKRTIPHFYVTHEYKMDQLMDLRSQFNNIVLENEKISINDFVIKAVALTLHQFPNLNASLDGNEVLFHGKVNIGVAVSGEGGLLTVVCREADMKSLQQIAAEIKSMAGRAREGKVKSEDIEGSTFSISNMGMYDVENFAAIVNPPEAAILAIGAAREVPTVDEHVVKPGWRMKATLSVDHRISYGVEAAKFMQVLAMYLEEPLRLLV